MNKFIVSLIVFVFISGQTFPQSAAERFNLGMKAYDNKDYVALCVLEGKLHNIIEVFWGSYFNHDLASNNGFNSSYDDYTYEYHTDLLELLDEKYNQNDPYKTMTIEEDRDYSFSDLHKWRWFDACIYDIYTKANDLGDISAVLVVNRDTDEYEIIDLFSS